MRDIDHVSKTEHTSGGANEDKGKRKPSKADISPPPEPKKPEPKKD